MFFCADALKFRFGNRIYPGVSFRGIASIGVPSGREK